MNAVERWFAESTNPDCRAGTPADVIDGTDLLIGVSGAGASRRGPRPHQQRRDGFAMANPNPEVNPEAAAPYVRIMATVAPTIRTRSATCSAFQASSAARSTCALRRSPSHEHAAARAIAAIVADAELREDYIIPSSSTAIRAAVAEAVAEEARATGKARAGLEVGFAPGEAWTHGQAGSNGG